MADASAIRMGGAYVEISADDAPMVRRLKESQARLQQWAAENSGAMRITRGTESAVLAQGGEGGGFFSGGFRGMQLFETGMKFATAVAAIKVGIQNVKIASALVRGDFEGMRKAAEDLPFGLGTIVKELSGPVDAAVAAIVARFRGISLGEDPADRAAAGRRREEQEKSVAQYNRGVKAIESQEDALRRASMTAQEYEEDKVRRAGLTAEAEERALKAIRDRYAIEDRKKAIETAARTHDANRRDVESEMDAFAQLTMSAEDFARYQARHRAGTEEDRQSWLSWRLAVIQTKDAIEQATEAFDRMMHETGAEWDEFNRRLQEQAEVSAAASEDAWQLTLEFNPELAAGEKLKRYKELLESGQLDQSTYQKAVRKALEEAAAAMPQVAAASITTRGTFSALEAASGALSAGGVQDRIAEATRQTAKNTARIAELAAKFGVMFTK